MPDPKNYNLDYRPVSYWGPQSLETHYGARVKGELRRQFALEGFVRRKSIEPGKLAS